MHSNKGKRIAKAARILLMVAMILLFVASLFGAVGCFALGEWPTAIPLLLIGTAYFVTRFTNRIYSSKPSSLNKLLSYGLWLSFVALLVCISPWLGAYAIESGAINYVFLVWAAFYAAIIIAAFLKFIPRFTSFSKRTKCKYIIIVATVITLIVIPLAIIEIGSEQDITRLAGALNEIEQKKLLPAGAIPNISQGDTGHFFFRKDGILGRADCNYVHPCPNGGGAWLLAMSKSLSARQDFAVTTLKSLGYIHITSAYGEVNGIKNGVDLSFNVTGLDGVKAPYEAPKNKVWQTVQLEVELSSPATGSQLPPHEIIPALNTFVSKLNHLSFSYPQSWSLENDSTAKAEVLILKSPGGTFGTQRSGEPTALSGEVVRVDITPCLSGRACSLDGVYDGVYNNSFHGPQGQLDDGTPYNEFIFQYKDEQATAYQIFFRDGNKYTFTFNAAGEDEHQLFSNPDMSKVFYSLMESIRFDD